MAMKSKKTFKEKAHRKSAQKHRDKRRDKRKQARVGKQTKPKWQRRGNNFNPLALMLGAAQTFSSKEARRNKKSNGNGKSSQKKEKGSVKK